MLLAIDVGNTHSVFALCEDEPRHVWRLETDADRTSDEYGATLLFLMQQSSIGAADISGVIIASVVPDAIFNLRRFCETYLKQTPLVVGRDGVNVSMPVDIDHPSELGADRLVNAVAAWDAYHEPLIVIDFGTATTFDVIDANGHYKGGVIAPGVNLSLAALTAAAAKLPGISISRPQKSIGTNTISAMQSGIYHGYMGLIDGLVARIKDEMGCPMKVVATGGLASLYARDNAHIDVVDADLTVRGLQLIYRQNKE